MLQWLKDHFIPSEANDHQPHFLRTKIAVGLIAIVFAVELLYLASSFILLPASDYFAAIFASVLVQQTNEERAIENLGTLTTNEKLIRAAQMKADDMAARGYFSHVTPDGKNSWYWFRQVGYNYAAAGENLAVNFTDSKDVTEAWMHSPSHRSNIMGENYTEIGIATARGMYKGKEAIFVVQMFGRPSLVARRVDTGTTTIDKIGSQISTVTPTDQGTVKNTETGKTPIKETLPQKPKTQNIISEVPTTTIVAGVETTKLEIESVAPDTLTAAPPEMTEITPTTNAVGIKPTTIERIIASPRQTTNVIYLILAALMTLALGLAVFIKIRIQHPHIVANGLLTIAVIITLLLLNSALHLSGNII